MRGHVRAVELFGRLRGLFPLTTRGLLVAAISGIALTRVAYESLDFVVLMLAYAALGLVALGVVSAVVGAVVVASTVRPPSGENRLVTDRYLPTEARLPSFERAPLLELDVSLASPAFERREEAGRELVKATHRGLFPETERSIRVRDAFGLAEVKLRLRGGALHALPHLGALEPAVALLSLAAGDDLAHPHGVPEGDRIELRRYVPGDPARFVHWKIYARTGELVVRVPEHAIKRADRVVVYFVAGEGDEASSAVALAIARSADLRTRVVLGCDGTDHRIGSVEEAELAIAKSYGFRGPTGLEHFVREADASGPAALVLLVPARPGAWLAPATELIRRRLGGARVLVGIDGMDDAHPSFIERVMFAQERKRSAAPTAEAQKIADALRGAGAQVIFLDRVTGRTFEQLPGRRRAA